MRRFLVIVAALAIAGTALASNKRPDMRLRVSTHSGPMPLELDLKGTIGKVSPDEIVNCLITVDYTYTTPAGSPLISKEEMPCRDAATEPKVPASFRKRVTLKEPGLYSYRLVLEGSDGKRMASASQEVKVYRGKIETGVTKSGSWSRD